MQKCYNAKVLYNAKAQIECILHVHAVCMCKLDAAAAIFGWDRSVRPKGPRYLHDVADQCGVDASQFPALNGEMTTHIQLIYLHMQSCTHMDRSTHMQSIFSYAEHTHQKYTFWGRSVSTA